MKRMNQKNIFSIGGLILASIYVLIFFDIMHSIQVHPGVAVGNTLFPYAFVSIPLGFLFVELFGLSKTYLYTSFIGNTVIMYAIGSLVQSFFKPI